MNREFNEFDPTVGQDAPSNDNAQAPDQDPGNRAPAPQAQQPQAPKPLEFKSEKDIRDYKIPGLTEKNLAGVALSEEALKIKAKLAREPRVQTFVPLDQGERAGAYRSVTINGYRCEVKKGKLVSLPQSIATLLHRSMQIESDTLNDHEDNLANAGSEKRRALGVE